MATPIGAKMAAMMPICPSAKFPPSGHPSGDELMSEVDACWTLGKRRETLRPPVPIRPPWARSRMYESWAIAVEGNEGRINFVVSIHTRMCSKNVYCHFFSVYSVVRLFVCYVSFFPLSGFFSLSVCVCVCFCLFSYLS